MRPRPATRSDCEDVARIAAVAAADVVDWLGSPPPFVVVTEDEGEIPLGYARAAPYHALECYRGVLEISVGVDPSARRRGVGTVAAGELVARARAAGIWKLIGHVLVEDDASRALFRGLGFREVGTYYRHAKLDGRWRDVVIVEKFLAPIGAETATGPSTMRPPAERIMLGLRSEHLEARLEAVAHARSLIETQKQVESTMIDATADAFFMAKVHSPAARARFLDLFRAYVVISPEAEGHLYSALLSRLDDLSIAADVDAFYEAAFVVKQVAKTGEGAHQPQLAPHRERLASWVRQTVVLPQAMRTRISAGNLSSLLLNLAFAACVTEEERAGVAALAADAKTRLGVEPPPVLRASMPPAAPLSRPPPLPKPPPPPVIEAVEDAPPPAKKRARSTREAKPRKPRAKRPG